MNDWLLAALVLSFAVWWMAPQQLPVSIYKLSLVALAAVAGYWIDRSLFPYARPDVVLERDDDGNEITTGDAALHWMGMAMLRRAIIVAATMLAVGLGA
jgi:hypothetical protein